MAENKVTIGVINWDSSVPSDTFFGYHVSKSLSPAKYRFATPYYADIKEENKIDFHVRSQEEYDHELQYAIDAGIDYFAYCWYGESKKPEREGGKVHHPYTFEISYGRKMHTKSALKDKIKMCAILGVGAGIYELSDDEFKDLALEMQEDYYQKIDGRPLVYMYRGYREDIIDKLFSVCAQVGTEKPYVAIMCPWDYKVEDTDYAKAEAVSAYSHVVPDVKTYDEFTDALYDRHQFRKTLGLTIIPHFSLGYTPYPRMDNPVPWHGYDDCNYNNYAGRDEIVRGGKKLAQWVKENKEICKTGHILTYAWNEFEEGAWICPTYDNEGKNVDESRVKAFKETVDLWKEEI